MTTVTVTGMSCRHCASSVREEVGGIAGVTGVEVDLASGEVAIASEPPIEVDAITSALEERGYQLAGCEARPGQGATP